MHWEHLVVETTLDAGALEKLGADRWELVAVVSPTHSVLHYFFKREMRLIDTNPSALLPAIRNTEIHMGRRDPVFPAGRHDLYTSQSYSAAIRSKDLLFVSGQVGSRSDGSPEPDFETQVRLAFANLEATLKAGGCGLDDIVDVTTFHTDPENQFSTVMAIKREVFPKAPYPNWTAVGVNWLAGFSFEIKVIARIPG